ncbi:unnamed protein product [Caenorhabditis auriculariae]|uniref:SUMO-activating enzyme subunit 1 n=1 Tax=Caenorhabditis auriculariae TaxID=2777116 RepID=A0A8S1H5D8_9PELO|nr:unnamed protein product [Caenorhabditis auriculariae]
MPGQAEGLSKDEAAVYDRQIRLWGLEAQNKLRASSVLIVGVTALGAEFAKNIVLAGLKSLTLMDHQAVVQQDLDTNFLFQHAPETLGKNRAAAAAGKTTSLNPNVELNVVEKSLETQLNELNEVGQEAFVRQFSLVVLIDQDYDLVNRVDKLCRQANVRFMCGSVFGWCGYAFFDFDEHEFLMQVRSAQTCHVDVDDVSSNSKAQPMTTIEDEQFVKKAFPYPSFATAFHTEWSDKKLQRKAKRIIPSSYFAIKSMLRAQRERLLTDDEEANIKILKEIWEDEVRIGNQKPEEQSIQPEKFDHLFPPQLTPTAAVVGGMMGQEAIKTLSEGKDPLKNIFIYSALDTTGVMCDFPPPK